jgi:hypothetical protein
MDPQQRYRSICSSCTEISVFHTDWWLDTICGADGWTAIFFEQDGHLAALPYATNKRLGFVRIGQPALTPYLGPLLLSTEDGVEMPADTKIRLLDTLLAQLPNYDSYSQRWQPSMLSYEPTRFHSTKRYTYVLSLSGSEKEFWKGLRPFVRRNVTKAQKKFNLQVVRDPDARRLYTLVDKTFQRQNLENPYHPPTLFHAVENSIKHQSGAVLIVEDASKEAIAGTFIVWDSATAYYLVGGSCPLRRTTGAATLCLWHSILLASYHTKTFDFEGSMIPSIEKHFQGFGADKLFYPLLSHTPSNSYRFLRSMYDLTRKLLPCISNKATV